MLLQTDQEILGLDVAVNEVLAVDEFDFLQTEDPQLEMRDIGEFPVTDVEEVLERRAQELHDQNAVTVFLGRVENLGHVLEGLFVFVQLLVMFGFLEETGLLAGEGLHFDRDLFVFELAEENVSESTLAQSLF